MSDDVSKQTSVLGELDNVAQVFEALSHAARRQLLLVLQARGESMTSKELADRFPTTWPTISRHLKALERAGLVSIGLAPDGRERRYTLESIHLQKTLEQWIANFR